MKYYFMQFKPKDTYSDVYYLNGTPVSLTLFSFSKETFVVYITDKGFSVFLGIKNNS